MHTFTNKMSYRWHWPHIIFLLWSRFIIMQYVFRSRKGNQNKIVSCKLRVVSMKYKHTTIKHEIDSNTEIRQIVVIILTWRWDNIYMSFCLISVCNFRHVVVLHEKLLRKILWHDVKSVWKVKHVWKTICRHNLISFLFWENRISAELDSWLVSLRSMNCTPFKCLICIRDFL